MGVCMYVHYKYTYLLVINNSVRIIKHLNIMNIMEFVTWGLNTRPQPCDHTTYATVVMGFIVSSTTHLMLNAL